MHGFLETSLPGAPPRGLGQRKRIALDATLPYTGKEVGSEGVALV